jgi:hypothetical protein
MFDMANDSADFRDAPDSSTVQEERAGHVVHLKDGRTLMPLYEGKMIWHFDHRYGTYEGQTEKQANKKVLPHSSEERHKDPAFYVRPRYWMDRQLVEDRLGDRWNRGWLIAFRDVGPKERTMVPTVIPRTASGHKSPVLLSRVEPKFSSFFLSQLASFAVDYCLRQKTSGGMPLFVVEQAPILAPSAATEPLPWSDGTVNDYVLPRVVELVYTAWDVASFAADCGFSGPPFVWNRSRRDVMRAELDALVFLLFGVDRSGVDLIMESFPVARQYDEREHGSYLTKERILDAYDKMAKATETGTPYQTILDPPPADPSLRVRMEKRA